MAASLARCRSLMAFSSHRSAESVGVLAGLGSVSAARPGPAAGTKKPLTQEGPPCCRAFSASARLGKQEDSGHVRQCTANRYERVVHHPPGPPSPEKNQRHALRE
ncbi:hypothetical protein GCM10009541_58400 [Micromonospora gifhornensis]|uniref:Uncharacterized protein n=1 Tax=Micromonospora gifhornensis TaxID=84594 RepID=A0ABQ4I719_9ACTN|nr:hypothetical protein Vgi01_03740 [Micromonospora gifhornensis]